MWKDIPGYEGLYKVSRDGEVKSYGRTIEATRGGARTLVTYQPRVLAVLDGGSHRNRARVNLYKPCVGQKGMKAVYVVDLVREVWGDSAANALPERFLKWHRNGTR